MAHRNCPAFENAPKSKKQKLDNSDKCLEENGSCSGGDSCKLNFGRHPLYNGITKVLPEEMCIANTKVNELVVQVKEKVNNFYRVEDFIAIPVAYEVPMEPRLLDVWKKEEEEKEQRRKEEEEKEKERKAEGEREKKRKKGEKKKKKGNEYLLYLDNHFEDKVHFKYIDACKEIGVKGFAMKGFNAMDLLKPTLDKAKETNKKIINDMRDDGTLEDKSPKILKLNKHELEVMKILDLDDMTEDELVYCRNLHNKVWDDMEVLAKEKNLKKMINKAQNACTQIREQGPFRNKNEILKEKEEALKIYEKSFEDNKETYKKADENLKSLQSTKHWLNERYENIAKQEKQVNDADSLKDNEYDDYFRRLKYTLKHLMTF